MLLNKHISHYITLTSNASINLCHHYNAWHLKATARFIKRQILSSRKQPQVANTKAEDETKSNTNIVLKPPLTDNSKPTWTHLSMVKYHRLLPGHHCESASLSPALSLSIPLPSRFSSSLLSQPKQGLRIAVN